MVSPDTGEVPPRDHKILVDKIADVSVVGERHLLAVTIIVGVIGVLGVWSLIHGFVVASRESCAAQHLATLTAQTTRERLDANQVATDRVTAWDEELSAVDTFLNPNATTDQRSDSVTAWEKSVTTARTDELVAVQHRVDDRLPVGDCR